MMWAVMGLPEEVLLCGNGDSQMEDLGKSTFLYVLKKSGYFESHVGHKLMGYPNMDHIT